MGVLMLILVLIFYQVTTQEFFAKNQENMD
jgi:hypothetical protein